EGPPFACGRAVSARDQCEEAACASWCAPAGNPPSLDACYAAADETSCAPLAQAARCAGALVEAGAPGAARLAGTDFGSRYDFIAPLFCAAADAGTIVEDARSDHDQG